MAVSTVGLRIIKRAVKIRVADGESIDDIIASYPKLSDAQAAELKAEYSTSADADSETTASE